MIQKLNKRPFEELTNKRFKEVLNHLRFYKGWKYNEIRDFMRARYGWPYLYFKYRSRQESYSDEV